MDSDTDEPATNFLQVYIKEEVVELRRELQTKLISLADLREEKPEGIKRNGLEEVAALAKLKKVGSEVVNGGEHDPLAEVEETQNEDEDILPDGTPNSKKADVKVERTEELIVGDGVTNGEECPTFSLENVESRLALEQYESEEENESDAFSTSRLPISTSSTGECRTLDQTTWPKLMCKNLALLQYAPGTAPQLKTVTLARKLFSCEICGRGFNAKKSLTRHYRLHTGEKPYSCSMCERAFTHSCSLAVHIRTHTKDKPYKCDTCQKGFYDRSALTRHILIHTGEKPFVCHLCGKSFNQKSCLNKHYRMYHPDKSLTDDNGIVCKVCGKSYLGNLKRHMLTHTGEKPHKCNICGKGFTQSNHVVYHMESHLPINK